MVGVLFVEMDHIQDEVSFLLEGADLFIKLGDPDSVESRHGMAMIEMPSVMNRLVLPGVEISIF
jgi:hypothetical protein